MEIQILTTIIIFLITGIFSGLIAGLLGVGGGIIIVPITYYIFINLGYSLDITMHLAIASSLGVIFFTSLSSMRSHFFLGNVDKSILKKMIFGIILGSILGSLFGSTINGEILIIIFISLALIVSFNMFFINNFTKISNDLPKNNFINNLIGSFIGFLSVLIGIGGGSFTVPTLSAFSKKIHKSIGTSSVFGFFIAMPGAITYMYTGWNALNLPPYSVGYVNLLVVLPISISSIFFAHFGAKLSFKLKKEILKKIFAVFLFSTCISLIIENFVINI
tara:strand:+ start:2326 stop:3153 length:828 start_codon:yes stop_codon:yes gene_type:complete